MLFTTGIFWIFYIVVYLFLFFNLKVTKSIKVQNFILLISSYLFYGYWDWRFLGLIFLVSLQTFLSGMLIKKFSNNKNTILILSLILNLSILFYFKYANFFVNEFISIFKLNNNFLLENIILPVGISFYIFQSFTYVLDIHNKKIKPENNLINYFTFIAFFPQLVAGPIERASSLLPQFKTLKEINQSNLFEGAKIIIIGLFLKVFIADNISIGVDNIFRNYQNLKSGTLILGALGFSIQIYGDFCGYSLIAIGIAKTIGFNLMKNFDFPYMSTSLQEFWRRWHISLSSFFRDYLYIPLGGNKTTPYKNFRNILITFFASGLWHGANWTFIIWGFLHGLIIIIEKNVRFTINKFFHWMITICVVNFLWILFRSETLNDFFQYSHLLFTTKIQFPELGRQIFIYSFIFLIIESILFRFKESGKTWFSSHFLENNLLAFMLVLVCGTILGNKNFIYFQF